jgi:hypothetical protein
MILMRHMRGIIFFHIVDLFFSNYEGNLQIIVENKYFSFHLSLYSKAICFISSRMTQLVRVSYDVSSKAREKINANTARFGNLHGSKTCKSEAVLWLGKVLNKDELIFQSRGHGVYKSTPPRAIKPLISDESARRGFAPKPSKAPLIGG